MSQNGQTPAVQAGAMLVTSRIEERKIKCNCHNNRCAQGYCDCLKNGMACDPVRCGCTDCVNTPENSEIRANIRSKQGGRAGALAAAQGFLGVMGITEISNTPHQAAGCSCKNSKCQKKYCECF